MGNTSLNTFLKALEKSRDSKSIFVPKWVSMEDIKFPAYTKFVLEVTEIMDDIIIHKFTVQKTENLSANTYMSKEEAGNAIKEFMVQNVIEQMLRYYLYGRAV